MPKRGWPLNATLIGQVKVGPRASVWYSATLRAEAEPIDIGAGTNIQDGVVVHVDPEYPVRVGTGVSVGHNAVLHGCTVEDGALIGMGAIVLQRSGGRSRVAGGCRSAGPAGRGDPAAVPGCRGSRPGPTGTQRRRTGGQPPQRRSL